MTDPFRIESSLVGAFGGVNFPLNATDFDGSLTPLDPARSRLAALFAAAINYELLPIWDKLTGKASALIGTRPVQTIFELDPQTHLTKQVNLKPPILALHRLGEQAWSEHTMQTDKCEQDFLLHYILPNLDIGETRKVFDVLRIIPEIVRRVIRARGHIAYDNGELQLFDNKCGLGAIQITKAEWGQAQFGGQVESPVWLATTMTLHVTEFGTDSEDEYGEFEGVDWNIGVGDSTGIQPNIIEAAVDV